MFDYSDEIIRKIALEIARQAMEGYERLNMDRVMAIAPWSRRQTERRFRDQMLTSPARYFRDCQAEIARERLRSGDDVLTASAAAGFSSPGRLHDAMVARYGLTPGEVRGYGNGVTVRYGFFETQIGVVLLAATERGVCCIALCGTSRDGETATKRLAELHEIVRNATIIEDADAVQAYGDQLVAYLEHRSPAFCPPLDIIQGTTFQREVWAELRLTRPGETVSYSEIAERIGRPDAVRAVANACGKNVLAVAIPCHRALRSDGSISGYRWGVEWKKRLLALEAAITAQAD